MGAVANCGARQQHCGPKTPNQEERRPREVHLDELDLSVMTRERLKVVAVEDGGA